MGKFFGKVLGNLDNMTTQETAGVETWALGDDSQAPSMVDITSDANVMRGFNESDVAQAFRLAGAMSSGIETFQGTAPVGKVDEVIHGTDLGLRDSNPEDYGIEKLNDSNLKNTKMFTIGLNILVGKANQGLETIMPVIMLGCNQVALEASIELEAVMDPFVLDGKTNKSKVKKVSALSLMSNPDVFKKYTTRVMPVKADDTDGFLFNAFEYETTVTGASQQTAPIRYDKQVNMLEITQTAAAITEGYNNELTSLDTAVYTENVYFGPVDVDGNPTQAIRVNVRDIAYANWTYSTQDKGNDISMSTVLSIALTPDTRDIADAVVAGISDLPVGTKVYVEIPLQGSGNVEDGIVNVLAGAIRFVNAVDVDGATLSAAELSDIKTTVEAFANIGYDLDTGLSNDGMRNKGLITTIDTRTVAYYIPQHPPIIKYKKAFTTCSADNLESGISSEVISLKAMMLYEAFNAIERQASAISNFGPASGDAVNIKTFGMGRFLFKPTLVEDAFDGDVDTKVMSSKDGSQDIRGALATKILGIVNRLDAESGYGLAKSTMESGEKTVINVWCNSGISKYLGGLEASLELGDGYVVNVLTHYVENKEDVYILFGTTNTNVTSELNPFQFGNIAVVPSLVYDGVRGVSGSTVAGTYTVPTFLPIINHPIIGKLSVTNINKLSCC